MFMAFDSTRCDGVDCTDRLDCKRFLITLVERGEIGRRRHAASTDLRDHKGECLERVIPVPSEAQAVLRSRGAK